jgi:hypothetical protein
MSKLQPTETQLSTNTNSDYVAERLVRLVSVGLKEATMDSPSFRASLNYMHLSILQCSQQLEKSIVLLQNYVQIWNDFLRISKDIEKLFTPYLHHTHFINNDVSKPCVSAFLQAQKIVSESALSLLRFNDFSFSSIREILDTEIPQYLELRRNFEKIQNKYDVISAKYMQLPKGYDPAKTREDALQLFEIRKQYIHISMSLWICIKQLETKVGKTATDTTNCFWNSFDSTNTSYGAKLSDAIGLSDIVKTIKQLNLCAELQQQSSKMLYKDLNRARLNSEEGAIKMYTPSPNVQDFDPSILNDSNLYLESENKLLEKHGWVFIKSAKLSGKGDVWIKRWMFVKNNVFGFLSISQDGQYVQESDKIGVLLVSVKYSPDEDRKFCFRINSQSTNLILQVETLIELKSWLTVFQNVTKLAIDEGSKIALNRYCPCLQILKLVPVVAKDLELIDVSNCDQEIEKTSKLIELQLSNLKFNLFINPPLKTSMTEKLAMSHLYISSTTVPSATTANFWGYVNWGLYFVLDEESKAKILEKTKDLPPRTVINLRYKDFYPEKLRVADAELRSIFEVFINDDEYTLLRFNASWSPNTEQKLFCTIFVTTKAFYVYSHTCGLISILPLPLSNFLDTEIIEKVNFNILKVYFINGLSLKLQLYAEDIFTIKTKFNYILSLNKASERPELKTIVSELLYIEKAFQRLREQKQIINDNNNNNIFISQLNNIDKIEGVKMELHANYEFSKSSNKSSQIQGISEFDSDNKLNYSPEMTLLLSKKIKLPAKALFHILFGDESFLLQCTLPLSSSIFRDDHSRHGLWRCDEHQKMTRVVWNSVFKIPCALQKIDNMVNNKYYNIQQETPYLRFVFGINRKIYMRFIIYSIDSKTCKLMAYYSLGREKNVLNWFSRKVVNQIMLFRIGALEEKLHHAVRALRRDPKKIASAIQKYGAITKYDGNETTTEELMFNESVNFLPLQLFSSFYWEKLNYEFERSLLKLVRFISLIIKSIIHFFNINMILVFILGTSILLNLFLMGKSTTSYWRERNINKHMKQMVGDKYLMERSISLAEINELIYPNTTDLSYVNDGSECYWNFLKSENLLDINRYARIDNEHELGDISDINLFKAKRELALAQKLTGLRIERNELLTKLNLLNYIEREFILKEWKNWVSSELSNCEKVKETIPDSYETIQDYCNEVKSEMINFYEKLL